MTTTFKLAVTSRRGLPAVLTAALLAWNIEETSETDDAIIEFEFTEPARKALRESNQYAIMNRAAVLSFDCKYSVTLYEIGCQRWQKRDVSWDGTPADLRAILGVPENTYDDWANLRRRVLDPAIEEVNHLAPVSYTHLDVYKRQGRRPSVRIESHAREDAAQFVRRGDGFGVALFQFVPAEADDLRHHVPRLREGRLGTDDQHGGVSPNARNFWKRC